MLPRAGSHSVQAVQHCVDWSLELKYSEMSANIVLFILDEQSYHSIEHEDGKCRLVADRTL